MPMTLLRNIARDRRGSMAIETAIVAPTLILMILGTFEVGTIVARRHELQSAANESEIIALATNQGAETDIAQMEAILRESVNLDAGDVTISKRFRCGTNVNLVLDLNICLPGQVVSSYLIVDINETYTPTWNIIGFGEPVTFAVRRTVQIS